MELKTVERIWLVGPYSVSSIGWTDAGAAVDPRVHVPIKARRCFDWDGSLHLHQLFKTLVHRHRPGLISVTGLPATILFLAGGATMKSPMDSGFVFDSGDAINKSVR